MRITQALEPGRGARRSGFTIPELLVAMALTMFIMVILTDAFTKASGSFRTLKAIGDMQEKTRPVAIMLRNDLGALHFQGGQKLSDLNFAQTPPLPPPPNGFFRIWQTTASTSENTDSDGVSSARANNHAMHFTVRLEGNRPENYLSCRVPPGSPLETMGPIDYRYTRGGTDRWGIFNTRWVEVAYFLRPIPGATAGTTPLYALYRRQRGLLRPTDATSVNWRPANPPVQPLPVYPKVVESELPKYFDISCMKDPNPSDIDAAGNRGLWFHTPRDITVPQRRTGMLPDTVYSPPTQYPAGIPWINSSTDRYYPRIEDQNPSDRKVWADDLLLNDVISFEVKVIHDGRLSPPTITNSSLEFVDLPEISSTKTSMNTVFNAMPVRVFDTWSRWKDDVYDYLTPTFVTPPAPPPPLAPLPPQPVEPWEMGWKNWGESPTEKSMPLRIRIRALRVTIRIWDAKSQLTRQVSIVQDM